MSAQHTQGPLAVNPVRPDQICTEDVRLVVAQAIGYSNVDKTIANARRLVACWNACVGVSTENLEDNAPVKELAERYNAVLAQRNDLLRALRKIITAENRNRMTVIASAAIDNWIAKATGGAV